MAWEQNLLSNSQRIGSIELLTSKSPRYTLVYTCEFSARPRFTAREESITVSRARHLAVPPNGFQTGERALTILRFYELAIISMIALAAHHASAQEYPTRAIRIVTPGVGGSADFSSRLIGQAISGPLGQQIIIHNRPTGPIPGEIVSKAAPDGYTLLLAGGSFFIGPLIQKTPYDPIMDFVAISLTATQPNVLVVHPSMPVKSVKELIVIAKARPGSMNYSMAGIGSSGHLAAELFKYLAKVDVVQVNYRGAGAALNDLLAGQVHMTFATAAPVVPLMKSARLKALAVFSAKPSVLFPGLPTVASSGLPGYETVSNLRLCLPRKDS